MSPSIERTLGEHAAKLEHLAAGQDTLVEGQKEMRETLARLEISNAERLAQEKAERRVVAVIGSVAGAAVGTVASWLGK